MKNIINDSYLKYDTNESSDNTHSMASKLKRSPYTRFNGWILWFYKCQTILKTWSFLKQSWMEKPRWIPYSSRRALILLPEVTMTHMYELTWYWTPISHMTSQKQVLQNWECIYIWFIWHSFIPLKLITNQKLVNDKIFFLCGIRSLMWIDDVRDQWNSHRHPLRGTRRS